MFNEIKNVKFFQKILKNIKIDNIFCKNSSKINKIFVRILTLKIINKKVYIL